MPKRFVLWAAVSSLPQAEKISNEHQIELGRKAAVEGQIVAELVVPGESRDIVLWEDACRDIAAYAQLSDLIQRRAFDVLVFLNPSRLGRTAALIMAVQELCRRAGIVLYDLDAPPATLDTPASGHADLLIAAIKSVGAQHEVAELKRRHSTGMLGRTMKGLFPGDPPWPWFRAGAGYGVDESAAPLLRLIFHDLYLNGGLGQIDICAHLNGMGHKTPTGQQWTKNAIAAIFDKVWLYAGFVELNRRSRTGRQFVRAKGQFPALIDEALAAAVDAERKRRATALRSVASPHRFSQCVWCVECDRRMNAGSRTRDDRPTIYEEYYCKTKHVGGYIAAKRIEREMRDEILQLMETEDLSILLSDAETHSEEINAAIASLEAQIRRYRGQLERADDAYVSGNMDSDRYQRQLARITGQIEDAQRQIASQRELLEQESYQSDRLDRLNEVVSVGLHMLDTPDIPAANAWFRARCRIWVQDNQVIEIEWP